MADSPQFRFRAALHKACMDLGEESWKSLCFLLTISERLREKGRSDVLIHLVDSGIVSRGRTEEFADLLRKNLERSDLAQKFLENCSERSDATAEVEAAHVEPRTRTNRRSHSPDRRHGKLFPGDVALEDTPSESTEADGSKPHCRLRPENLADSRCSPIFDEEETRQIEIFATLPRSRRRHDSSLSQYSNRSSGYGSWRDSSATTRDSIISLQSIPDDDEVKTDSSKRSAPDSSYLSSGQLQTVPESSTEPEAPSLNRNISSSSSNDDFQSCSSGSLESLMPPCTATRETTTRGEDFIDFPVPLRERGRKSSPEVVVDSPTYSNVSKKITVQMCLKKSDMLQDIAKKRTKKVYRSSPPFPPCTHGLQFQLRFCPTNHEGNGAALYVDVVSREEKGGTSIPPLGIIASVCDSKQLAISNDMCTNGKNCIAFEQRGLRDGFISQGHCIAPFPRLVDHSSISKVTGDAVVIQVVMEYSTPHSENAS